jgi:hypothetical protein
MNDDDAPSWLTAGNNAGGGDASFNDPMEPPSAAMQAAEVPKSSLIDADGNLIPQGTGGDEEGGKKGSKKNSKRASKKAAKSAERTMLESGVTAAPPPPEEAAADEEGLNAAIVIMRMANMGVSTALVASSIVNLIGLPSSISVWVLSVYAMCGGLLVCCLETQLKFLRTMIGANFGFLLSGPLRFLFYLLLASISLSYQTIFGYIVAACLVVVAVYNTYILCRYPTYRHMREKMAAEEDQRIQDKIGKETKKQVLRNMMGN